MNFKFTTAGESHGPSLVAIVEGVPYGTPLDAELIDRELWRRQQGYGRGGRMKIESDTVEIVSGVRHGRTIGSPIALRIENRDHAHWQEIMSADVPETTPANPRELHRPRPGHADLAGGQKLGADDLRDVLERASARETAARVAAGAVAKALLREFGIEIASHVVAIGAVSLPFDQLDWEDIVSIPDDSPLRCFDRLAENKMIAEIDAAKADGDTLGGVFETLIRGVPPGLGSYASWDEKLDGRLAHAFLSIPAVKAFEIGDGVANAGRRGSLAHDEILLNDPGELDSKDSSPNYRRASNRAGGLEAGVTNGEMIRLRGYMKPISTLRKPLRSVDIRSKMSDVAGFERSDVCAVPAAGVISEAMAAIVLADAMREKFGGDSLNEMKRNFDGYLRQISKY